MIPRRARKWLLVGLGVVAAYGAAGFLIPPLLRGVVARRASALLGRDVSLERLRFNPFAVSLTADGLRITDRDRAPLLSWERLYVDFDLLASLARREWSFGEIRLVGASGRIVLLPGGALNIDDIVARLKGPAAGAAPAGPPPVVHVSRLRIEDSSLGFVDRTTPTTFTTMLGPLRITLTDFTTRRGRDSAYSFRGRTEAGESFSWSGRCALNPLGSEGTFSLEAVTLGKYRPYYGGVIPFDVRGGKGDVRAEYQVAWGADRRVLRLDHAAVTLRDVKLSEHGKEEIAVEAPSAEVRDASVDLLAGDVSVGAFTTRGGHLLLRKSREGRVNLLDMLLPFFQEPAAQARDSRGPAGAPGSAAAPPPAPAVPGVARKAKVLLKDVSFSDYAVDVEDLSPPRPVRARLDRINLTLHDVDNVPGTTSKGSLDLRFNGTGTLHAEGGLSFVGLDGSFGVKIDGLEAAPLDPYVEPVLDLRVTSGVFSADGQVEANLMGEKPKFSFRGDAWMDRFAAVDGRDRREFVRWKSVRMGKIDYSLENDRLRIGDLSIAGAEGILAVAPDGAINLLTVLRMPQPAATGETAGGGGDGEGSGVQTRPGAAPAAPVPPPPAAEAGDTRIARARLTGGRLRLVDYSMTPPATLLISRIEGSMAGLSSRRGARADVDLKALAGDTAPVTLRGQLDPLGSDVFADLTLTGKGIDLGPLGPYSARYLGYALDRARLDLEMRYRVENRALEGTNLFIADPFLLGEKTDSPDATHLPVRLGLALLRDRDGVVKLDVPVEGSLDDPKFRLGRVILHALVNVFTKLVTSPFKMLARSFAGHEEEDLSTVDFGAGSAALSDEARSRLDALTKGLAERPGLTLLIAGASDPATDTEALRHGKLEALVREEKWRSLGRREREATPPDAVAVDSAERPKLLKAAWKTFKDLHPDAAAAPKPGTPEEIEARILAGIAVDAGDLSTLASRRGEAVRDRIAAGGIDAGRLFLKEGAAPPSTRVTLELQ